MFKKIFAEQKDDAKILYLSNRKSNPIDEELLDEIKTACKKIEKSNDVNFLIITSKNKNFFSSGFDIFDVTKYNRKKMKNFFLKYIRLYRYLFAFPKTLIFAINGHTLAGGFILTLCGDYRICANVKSLKIGLNELKMGVPIPYGSIKMLQYICGKEANLIALNAKNLSPKEAYELGIVDILVPRKNLLSKAISIAKVLSQKPQNALRKIKFWLKTDTLEKISSKDERYVDDFLDVWFSKDARDRMKELINNI